MTSTKIREIKTSDYKKIGKLFENFDIPVNCVLSFENAKRYSAFPLKKIHSHLPLKLKFLQESYVAASNKDILGLVSLMPDGTVKSRWKINQLLLEPNSYDVGKLLIDYVVSKYGAEGVESFITEVVATNADALELFKKGCGFRQCCKTHIYKLSIDNNLPDEALMPPLREMSNDDISKVADLFNDALTPQTRVSLSKTPDDFYYSLYDKLTDNVVKIDSKRWVIEDPSTKNIIAFVIINTRDNNLFYLSAFVSMPYAEYYYDILNFAIRYAGLKNRNASLFINVSEAVNSTKKYLELLNESDAEHIETFDLLVKDFWKPQKEPKSLASPVLIFSDISSSPACNFVSS